MNPALRGATGFVQRLCFPVRTGSCPGCYASIGAVLTGPHEQHQEGTPTSGGAALTGRAVRRWYPDRTESVAAKRLPAAFAGMQRFDVGHGWDDLPLTATSSRNSAHAGRVSPPGGYGTHRPATVSRRHPIRDNLGLLMPGSLPPPLA